MDDDAFLVSLLEEMNDEELEAFCYYLRQDFEDKDKNKGEDKVCQ